MSHRTFTPEELTEYLHLAKGDVERLLRESDIPREVRGSRILFRQGAIDEWASQRILNLPSERLDAYHEKTMRGTRDIFPGSALFPELMRPQYIDLALTSKTSSSVIRDVVGLAEGTGRVHDPRELLTSVREREEMCSTALPGGLALLHARHHVPYRFDDSFVVLGRTFQSVPFSAEDGQPTRLFFLICCQDDRIHLHTLARLCLLAIKTDIVTQLLHAEDPYAAYDALIAAELSVLPPPAPEARKKTSRGAQS